MIEPTFADHLRNSAIDEKVTLFCKLFSQELEADFWGDIDSYIFTQIVHPEEKDDDAEAMRRILFEVFKQMEKI